MYKRLFKIGFAGYLFLFLFSILFYKERTVFCDIAFSLFTIVQDNTFQGDMRFGIFLTQVYPLIALRAHMSLSSIMMVYSVAFIFYHFIYYLVCGLVLKKYEFGIIILLFNILFLSDTFYWVQSELPQGINLFILTLALASAYNTEKSGPVMLSIIFLGLFIVSFMHPLIIFIVLYCYVFLLINKKNTIIRKKMVYSMLIFSFGIYLIKVNFFKVAYDTNTIDSSLNNFSLKNILELYSNKRFLHNCINCYYWIPLLSFTIIVYYIVKREWIKGGLFLVFMIGYLELVNITHSDYSGNDFYLENLYLPLGIFIALPLVFDILPSLKFQYVLQILFALILVTGCIRIFNTHNLWTERLNWERTILKQNEGRKIVLNEKNAPLKLLMMTWGTAWEFWLLSSTELTKPTSMIITAHPDDYNYIIGSNKHFLVPGGNIQYSNLHGSYFNLDTTTHYEVIK